MTSISRTVTKLQAWVLMRTFEQIALLVLGNPRLRIDFETEIIHNLLLFRALLGR